MLTCLLLHDWPKIPLRKFTLKNCFFSTPNIRKDNDKSKYAYSGYGIAFYTKSEWNFGNDSGKNVISFAVDNSSSSQSDNCKNVFGSVEAEEVSFKRKCV